MRRPTLDKFPRRVLAQIDIQTAYIASRLIIAAERLQVFRALHSRPRTAEAIGRKLGIHRYYLAPFLNSLVAMGLLRRKDGRYWNTSFADKYFVTERSIYWTRRYSAECVAGYRALTELEQALAAGKRYEAIQGVQKEDYLRAMTRDPRQAEDFTQMLFHLHQGEAAALADYLDLSAYKAVLDAGGGSGVMSIALAKRNPHLRACILDIAPVCKVAAGNVRRARLSARIRTAAGNIREPLPAGFDVVLACDIGVLPAHFLQHAYKCLPPAGMLVLVDRYLSDSGIRPLDRLVEYFAGGGFGLATRAEVVAALKSAGFKTVNAKKVYRDVWFITGRKPALIRSRIESTIRPD